jgi:hypothetical protein
VPKIDQILAQVEGLVATVKPQEAEDRLRSLIQTIGDDELRSAGRISGRGWTPRSVGPLGQPGVMRRDASDHR